MSGRGTKTTGVVVLAGGEVAAPPYRCTPCRAVFGAWENKHSICTSFSYKEWLRAGFGVVTILRADLAASRRGTGSAAG